jgi:hypothetical protein
MGMVEFEAGVKPVFVEIAENEATRQRGNEAMRLGRNLR